MGGAMKNLNPAVKESLTAQSSDHIADAGKVIAEPVKQESVHPDDEAADRFAAAMKAKLAKKRADGRGGWEDKGRCTAEFLNRLLNEHVGKGDPVDVGNLAMMLWNRGEPTTAKPVQQEPVAWVDVSEQMPKPSKAVLIHYVINSPAYGGTRSGVIRALWIPAKTEESNDEDHFEYDEDMDTYYIPEGWYELVDNWDEYSSVHVCEGDITHWMPLPEFPNAAPVSAKREWVDLTVSDLDAIIEKHYDDEMDLKAMILDGIAAFKEKNK